MRGCSVTLVSCFVFVLSGCREEAPLATSQPSATRVVTVTALPRLDSAATVRTGAQIRSEQAAASPEYAFRASNEGSLAENAAQQLTARVAPDGVQVVMAAGGAPLTLHFAGIGRGETLAAVRAPRAPAVEKNAVTLDREGVREWYVNGPLGLEQGFTLAARSSGGTGNEPLALAIDVDATWRLVAAGDGVLATDASSGRSLHYGALAAYDAEQKELPSRLEVTGQRIVLRVDDRGAVYPIEIDPLVGVKEYEIGSAESFAISGDTLVSSDSNTNKAYVITRSGSTWAFSQQLTDSATFYGSSVAVDGDALAVGARWDATLGAGVGSVFLYERSGTSWTLATKVYPTLPHFTDAFGAAMVMRGDRLLVAASNLHDMYFFARSASGVWSLQTAVDGGSGYGASLGIDGNAGTAVIGGLDMADAYAESAGTWAVQSKLSAPVNGKKFGAAAAVSGDTIVVGARDDDGAAPGAGAAYVFRRSGSTWSQTQKLTASNGAPGDRFGEAVGMANGRLVIGAPYTDVNGNDTGAIYVFEDQGGTYVEQLELLQAGNNPPAHFGKSLSFDGARIAVQNSSLYVFALVSTGAACAQDAECGGGFCVDGVCCGSTCGGGKADDCVACSVAAGAAQDGVCGPIGDGVVCDDHDICSAQSACQAGTCVGQSLTTCPSPSDCQVGACDPATGLCGSEPAPQGTPCDDGSACTQSSSCNAIGICSGPSSIVCPDDACNYAGCNPGSGACDKLPKPNGTSCDDGDPCTTTDHCTAGACAGAPVVCTAPDECHDAGSCGAAGCAATAKPDGTPCSLGACQAGVCTKTSTGATSTATSSSTGAGGTSASSGSATTGSAGGEGVGGSGSNPETSEGCGCVVAGAAPSSWSSVASLVALASALARRRRRARRITS